MTILFVIQIIVVIMMIGVILMQKTTSDGLLTSGGSPDSFLSGRASANVLTRTTAILATIFIVNSLVMAYMVSHTKRNESVVDEIISENNAAPAESKTTSPTAGEPGKPSDGVLEPGNVSSEGKTQAADSPETNEPNVNQKQNLENVPATQEQIPAANKPADNKPASVPTAD